MTFLRGGQARVPARGGRSRKPSEGGSGWDWLELFGVWVELDLAPDAYWNQTPLLIHEAVKAKGRAAETGQRNRGWQAWTTAALGRSKRMPELEKVIGKPRGRKPMSVAEQAAKLRSIALQMGGTIKTRGDG